MPQNQQLDTMNTNNPDSEEEESSFLLGRAGQTKKAMLTAKTRKKIFAALAFFVSVFVLFPLSLKLALGDSLRNEVIGGIGFVCFGIIFYYSALQFKEQNVRNKEARTHKQVMENVVDGTYRCVQPQIIGSLVVFPIKVNSRSAMTDRVIKLGDEHLYVELAQNAVAGEFAGSDRDEVKKAAMLARGEDTNNRLRQLLYNSVNTPQTQGYGEFNVRVFSGNSGGPTGLAVGVSKQDFGNMLAGVVGNAIESCCVGFAIRPPTIGGGGKRD